MNKSIKGLLAAGAGVVLLTAVGGTFANWTESDTQVPGSVTAGHLDWTVAAGSWSDVTATTPVVIGADISAFRMVPGDVLEYTTSVTPDLLGDNLTATLSATLPAESGTLADDVTVVATFDGGTSSKAITEANDETAVPVVVTVTMPYANTIGEDEVLDLSNLTLSLVQDANPVIP